MKVMFKGIVRGTYSMYQPFVSDAENPSVVSFSGNSLEEVLRGLVLPEWLYVLYVNGRRITNPEKYLRQKGIWNMLVREPDAA